MKQQTKINRRTTIILLLSAVLAAVFVSCGVVNLIEYFRLRSLTEDLAKRLGTVATRQAIEYEVYCKIFADDKPRSDAEMELKTRVGDFQPVGSYKTAWYRFEDRAVSNVLSDFYIQYDLNEHIVKRWLIRTQDGFSDTVEVVINCSKLVASVTTTQRTNMQ